MSVVVRLVAAHDNSACHPTFRTAGEAVRALEGVESAHALLAWRTLVRALRSPASAAEGVREVVAAGLRDTKGMVDAPRPRVLAAVAEVTTRYGQMVREADRAAVRKAMVSVLVAPRLEALLQTTGDGRATAVSPSSPMTALLEVDGSAAEAARVMMSAIEAALGHRGQEVFPKGRAGRGSRAELAGSSGAVSAGDESNDTEL
eukprot:jgi/Tetstr1/442229/TSEL_030370.t1